MPTLGFSFLPGGRGDDAFDGGLVLEMEVFRETCWAGVAFPLSMSIASVGSNCLAATTVASGVAMDGLVELVEREKVGCAGTACDADGDILVATRVGEGREGVEYEAFAPLGGSIKLEMDGDALALFGSLVGDVWAGEAVVGYIRGESTVIDRTGSNRWPDRGEGIFSFNNGEARDDSKL